MSSPLSSSCVAALILYARSVNSSIKAAAKVYLPSNESVKRRKTFEPLVEARAQKDEGAFWRETPGEAKIWKGKNSSRSSEGEGRANGLELRGSSKYLEGFRVSLKSLGRRDEYQVRRACLSSTELMR